MRNDGVTSVIWGYTFSFFENGRPPAESGMCCRPLCRGLNVPPGSAAIADLCRPLSLMAPLAFFKAVGIKQELPFYETGTFLIDNIKMWVI